MIKFAKKIGILKEKKSKTTKPQPQPQKQQANDQTSIVKKEETDPRLWCFHCDDIAKFVIMVHYCISNANEYEHTNEAKKPNENNLNTTTTKNNESLESKSKEPLNIISLLEQYGFDGLWNLVSAQKQWTFNNSGWISPQKEPNPIYIREYRNERDFKASAMNCPDLEIASYDLLLYAKKYGLYFAQVLHKYGRPHQRIQDSTAISYSWRRKVLEVVMYVHEASGKKSPFMWLDIININQNSRDIGSELNVIPLVYSEAKYHTMISRGDLHRGWCFFEFVLRSDAMAKRGKDNPQPKPESEETLVSPDSTAFCEWEDQLLENVDWFYNNNRKPHLEPLSDYIREWTFRFDQSQFTVESDRGFVRDKIIQLFGSVSAGEKVLLDHFVKHVEEFQSEPTIGIVDPFDEEEMQMAFDQVAKLGISVPEELVAKCHRLFEVGKKFEELSAANIQ